LHLAANNLNGSIPLSLGEALGSSLQYLELSSNLLTGELPRTLTEAMPRLHTLYIEPKVDGPSPWSLTGTLPADMGSTAGLPNLRWVLSSFWKLWRFVLVFSVSRVGGVQVHGKCKLCPVHCSWMPHADFASNL
jgi:hypothetical protein